MTSHRFSSTIFFLGGSPLKFIDHHRDMDFFRHVSLSYDILFGCPSQESVPVGFVGKFLELQKASQPSNTCARYRVDPIDRRSTAPAARLIIMEPESSASPGLSGRGSPDFVSAPRL